MLPSRPRARAGGRSVEHEVRVPREHEPRAAHADERRDRDDRPAARHRAHKEQREYAEQVARSGEQMLAIINDILDISKIEAGQVELDTRSSTCATRSPTFAGAARRGAGEGGCARARDRRGAAARAARRRAGGSSQILLNMVCQCGQVHARRRRHRPRRRDDRRAGARRRSSCRWPTPGIGVEPELLRACSTRSRRLSLHDA